MILQSIEIENFRCFRHSCFENFGQVNLIGGKNNAGKTALLEAILLQNEPTWASVSFLQQMRGENPRIFTERPELAWGNFFLKQDKNQGIKLQGTYDNEYRVSIEITCEEKPKSFKNGVNSKQNGELVKIVDSTAMSEVGISTLTISSKYSDKEYNTEIAYNWEREVAMIKSVHPDFVKITNDTFLIPTGFKKSADSLAREFDKAKLNEDAAFVLSAFQIIDDSIKKIDVINLDPAEPRIHIYRDNEPPQPLNFFGDALNKIADLILRVVNNPNCTLLIDEIENGIHHDNQQEFWRMLIQLAVKKNVQIFATSHSAEMIGAFQAAAIANKQEEKVRFIEMYKSKRTGEIVGDSVDMETLAFDIQNKNPYRGEE